MRVSEEAPVGTTVGKVFAEDSDIGDNAAMDYFIEDSSDAFYIITDNETQEGIVLLKKVRSQELKKISKYLKENPQASWVCKKGLLLWIISFFFSLGIVILLEYYEG